jgi:hypothetical protein
VRWNFVGARPELAVAIFKRKSLFLPEILVVIAVNVVAAVLVYYAILLWAFYR